MQDLRLIGVNEDGLHLLLAGAAGERFRVPLDDALRAAARQDRPRLGQLQIEMEGGLRPRDIQAMVRAGASAEDVAERAGWTVEKVRKYEGPILAERAHVADLARGVRLRTRGGGTGGASTLSTRVADRMRARGVDAETSSWDAWKLPETQHWTVALSFAAGGRQRRASWSFDLTSRVVDAEDDEARWLSEEEAAAGPIPGSDAGAGPADVYDVEAEGGVVERRRGSSHAASGQGASGQGASGQGTSGRPTRSRAAERGAEGEEPLDLMTAMRERSGARGRRTGRRKTPASAPTSPPTSPTALPGDPGRTDALPIAEISFDPVVDAPPPAAHTHPHDDPDVSTAAGDLRVTTTDDATTEVDTGTDVTEPGHDPADPGDTTDAGHTGDATDGEDASDTRAAAPRPPTPPTSSTRKGRASVPSWDDIMFGSSRD